jgi:hypothetical protein
MTAIRPIAIQAAAGSALLNVEIAMKTINALLTALLLFQASSAMALLIIPSVPEGQSIRFSFTGWNEATTRYTANCGSVSGSANAPGCDSNTAIGSRARVAQTINAPDSGGLAREDGWGVLRVTSIEADGVPFYSNPVGAGSHITAFFYHLVDGVVIVNPTTTQTYSYGGRADFYITDDNAAALLTGIPSPRSRDNSTPTPTYGGASGITSGTLLLSLTFGLGGDSQVPLSTLSGAFNNASIGGGSTSLLDVDVTAGLWKNVFDTNSFTGADGDLHDLELAVSFRCGGGSIGVRCDPSHRSFNLFSSEIDGSISDRSAGVPEPGTISLIAAVLIGMGILRRRHSLPVRKSGLR